MGILRGISDSNKRVQGAACAALAAIEEVIPLTIFITMFCIKI